MVSSNYGCILLSVFVQLIYALEYASSSCSSLPPLSGFPQFILGAIDKEIKFDTPDYFPKRKIPWDIEITTNEALQLTQSLSKQNSAWEMTRTYEGQGMHHEVLTNMQITGSNFSDFQCYTMFVEKVSTSFFLDIYEIARTSTDFSVYYTNYIDIEKPSYESQNHTVLVFSALNENQKASTKIKWHTRYHAPSNESLFVNVTIPKPDVYLFCTPTLQKDDSLEKEDACQIYAEYNIIMAPCPHLTRTLCPWMNLSLKTGNDLVFKWPVGSLSEKNFVTFLTIASTVVGALFLLAVTVYSSTKSQHTKQH
uniref:Phosphatidylinositol-glycan biosynthesis class X protein n=1 Tax=Phallusia mammillata TaxID=59560 RepID=A0A6F9DNV5_9ASCI|nr:phosphatidylinositol-glycan biosynthesis class X protein-like [Phallusia mammillata]